MGRILSVANQKGGVGKTTTTINLATALALADQRVLVVDMDPQGNLTSGIGLKGHAAPGGTVYQALTAAEPVADAHINGECPRLAAAAPYFKRPYFDSTFELGFASILDGIARSREALLAKARSTPKPTVHPKT